MPSSTEPEREARPDPTAEPEAAGRSVPERDTKTPQRKTSGGTTPDEAAEEQAGAAEPVVPGPAQRSAGDSPGRPRRTLAVVVSVFGELLITAGLVLALFVAYSLWWTNVLANQEAKRDSEAVRDSWQASEDDDPAAYEPEDGIGFLHVPTMNTDEILVKEGIDLPTLNGGVAGYYDQPIPSAMPWDQEGNFTLAAHRDGHGAKFHDIHKIEEGDPIVFETKNTWYVYTAYAVLPETSRYNVDVLQDIPEESGKEEAGRYITLTTCTPVYTSQHRYIVWGELERTEAIDDARTPPAELTSAG